MSALRLHERFEKWTRPRQPETLPARIDRRRVYVLPTRFGLFFALLLAAMGLGALNYNNNPALLLVLLLAGAANASLLVAHLQLTGLQVGAIGAEPVPAGSVMSLRVHARAGPGRSRRGLRVRCGDAGSVLSLEDGAGQAVLALPTLQRGWLELPRLRISTTRPLGLAVAWAYVWPDAPLLVYPAPEAHGPPLPHGIGDASVARLHPAGDDVHHLRAYRRGDPRRACVCIAARTRACVAGGRAGVVRPGRGAPAGGGSRRRQWRYARQAHPARGAGGLKRHGHAGTTPAHAFRKLGAATAA